MFEQTERSKSERYRTERSIVRLSALTEIRMFGFRTLTVVRLSDVVRNPNDLTTTLRTFKNAEI